jgi:hypothetical protein
VREVFLNPRRRSLTQRFANILIELFRPFLRLVGLILSGGYKFFFSWCANPALDRWTRQSFAREIEEYFPFLFDQFAAKIVPCPRPQAQDPQMGYVCFATPNILFEFSHWHGENHAIRVSPTLDPLDSYDVADALRVLAPPEKTIRMPTIESWRLFARLLEPKMPLLEAAFDPTNFPDTRRKLRISLPDWSVGTDKIPAVKP